jgi:hypothetical protein
MDGWRARSSVQLGETSDRESKGVRLDGLGQVLMGLRYVVGESVLLLASERAIGKEHDGVTTTWRQIQISNIALSENESRASILSL